MLFYFPLQACSDKLKWEMKEFGYPPTFPTAEELAASAKGEIEDDHEPIIKDKSKGKKVFEMGVFCNVLEIIITWINNYMNY